MFRSVLLAAIAATAVQPAAAAPVHEAPAGGRAAFATSPDKGGKCGPKRFTQCVVISIHHFVKVGVEYDCGGRCFGAVFWEAYAYQKTKSGYVRTSDISVKVPNGSYGQYTYVTISTDTITKSRHNEYLADVVGCNFYPSENCGESKIGVTVTPSGDVRLAAP